jgi:hypothetical protein
MPEASALLFRNVEKHRFAPSIDNTFGHPDE